MTSGHRTNAVLSLRGVFFSSASCLTLDAHCRLPDSRSHAMEVSVSPIFGRPCFPGPPNEQGERGPIDADKLLRNILRRALRRAGLPPLRFHDMRYLAGTLMSEAGVPPKRAQMILGHADVRTTLAIYTHTLKRKHDNSANRMADIAGLSDSGNKWETVAL
jgi:integrase